LIDTSVWISFFKGEARARHLHELIQTNRIRTNELILAELLPALRARREKRLVSLLLEVGVNVLIIDWNGIMDMQTTNLRNGINNVGMSDMIILQNAIQHGTPLFSFDKHFLLMKKHFPLMMYDPETKG
jgi:predicted nucleic acid-binding protein